MLFHFSFLLYWKEKISYEMPFNLLNYLKKINKKLYFVLSMMTTTFDLYNEKSETFNRYCNIGIENCVTSGAI